MAVTVAVRGTVRVIRSVAATRPRPAPVSATRTGAVIATGTAAVPATGTGAGVVPVSTVAMVGALSRTGSVIVALTWSRAGTSTAAGNGTGPEPAGTRPLRSEFRALTVTRACSGTLTRPRSGPVAAIDPSAGPVSGTATRSGRPVGAADSAARP